MSQSPAVAFKYAAAHALGVRARIRQLAAREVPLGFRALSSAGAVVGFIVLARHASRPGLWQVHYLDGEQQPIASVDAGTHLEGLYLASLAGADLSSTIHPLSPVFEMPRVPSQRA